MEIVLEHVAIFTMIVVGLLLVFSFVRYACPRVGTILLILFGIGIILYGLPFLRYGYSDARSAFGVFLILFGGVTIWRTLALPGRTRTSG
jgi:Na+/phosphate symporter